MSDLLKLSSALPGDSDVNGLDRLADVLAKDYAAPFADLVKEVRAQHQRLDERLARVEAGADRAVAAEAAEHALAALAGLRHVAARLDADVAVAESRAAR